MRRRIQLQVNTFPFLAVLLCAMGSLILILLVVDRRSRMAALQRGQDEAGRTVRERAEAIAARERENSGKRGEIETAYDRKKAELKAHLDAEQRALDAEMRQVQGRLAEIALELRGEEELVGKLRTNVRTDQVALTRHEQALATARKEAADLSGKLTAADRARHELAADTIRLGQIIRDLQAARERDAMTYSVVPYKGKRGEKRRPLYVECSAAGLVFHPDKLALADPSVPSVQEEIARRTARLTEDRKKVGLREERAYLLLLVRPDGIKRFYQMQSAIHDLPVEFGFEFVDADWELTIPVVGDLAEETPAPVEAGGLPGDPATGANPSVRLSRPQPFGEGPVLEMGVGAKATLTTGDALPLIGERKPGESPLARLPSVLPGTVAVGVEPNAPAPQAPDLATAKSRIFPLLPTRLGKPDDTVVYVECLSDGVVVHPSGKSFSIDSLNHSPAHNPFYQAVAAQLAKHTGNPARRAIRYLTHPDAEKTFHLAYPAFNHLGVKQTRIDLRPGDDVSQIVGSE